MRFQRHPWNERAAAALAPILFRSGDWDGERHIREGVLSGRMELWLVNDTSWAVTETHERDQMIWCYCGRDVREFAACMYTVAQQHGLARVRFQTRRKGLPRMLAIFGCQEIAPQDFSFDIQGAA